MSDQATTIAVPDTKQIIGKMTSIFTTVKELKITSTETFQQMGEVVKTLKQLEKEIDDTFDKSIKLQHEAHKTLVASKKKHKDPVESARRFGAERMGEYQQEQDRLRKIAENKAAKEADERLAAQVAEQERLQAEANAKAEAETAELTKIEETERLEQASKLEELGFKDEANELLNAPSDVKVQPVEIPFVEPIPMPTIIVNQPEAPVAEGISFKDNWSFEVTDANAIPREFLMIDEVAIGKVVRALKARCNITGIKVINKKTPVVKG